MSVSRESCCLPHVASSTPLGFCFHCVRASSLFLSGLLPGQAFPSYNQTTLGHWGVIGLTSLKGNPTIPQGWVVFRIATYIGIFSLLTKMDATMNRCDVVFIATDMNQLYGYVKIAMRCRYAGGNLMNFTCGIRNSEATMERKLITEKSPWGGKWPMSLWWRTIAQVSVPATLTSRYPVGVGGQK